MFALDWRGNPMDPVRLLAKYHLAIAPATGRAWRIVELRETHGRPELRSIILGTDEAIAFTAATNGGLVLRDLRSAMKEEGNLLNIDVKNDSYYEPRKMAGPWSVFIQDVASEALTGWGLAVDPDPMYGPNPGQFDDNRYLTVQAVWQLTDDGGVIVPPTPVDPPDPPVVPPLPSGADLAALQAYIRAQVKAEMAAALDRIRAAL